MKPLAQPSVSACPQGLSHSCFAALRRSDLIHPSRDHNSRRSTGRRLFIARESVRVTLILIA